MSRPLRIQYQNALYHVMNRGRGHGNIFHHKGYFNAFLKCVEEAWEQFNLEVIAYCLMSNHYHLLVRTPDANLSRCMRHIDGVYTQRYNRLEGTDGSLFRGRYKSKIIEKANYLHQLSRYIHRNPIDTANPLVQSILDYPWSSYANYLGIKPSPDWLNPSLALEEFETPESYAEFVEEDASYTWGEISKHSSTCIVLGSKPFQQSIFNKITDTNTLEIKKPNLSDKLILKQIVQAVGNYYNISPETIVEKNSGTARTNNPRDLSIYLTRRLTTLSLSDIAYHFNLKWYTSASNAITRAREEIIHNAEFKAAFIIITQTLNTT